MKKLLIIIFGLLINFNSQSQCTIGSAGVVTKARTYKSCFDSVTVYSRLKRIDADSLTLANYLKVNGTVNIQSFLTIQAKIKDNAGKYILDPTTRYFYDNLNNPTIDGQGRFMYYTLLGPIFPSLDFGNGILYSQTSIGFIDFSNTSNNGLAIKYGGSGQANISTGNLTTDRFVDFPDADGEIVYTDNTTTLFNKTWNGVVIGSAYGGAGGINGLLKANGSGMVSAAVAEVNYTTPTGSGALTNKTYNGVALSGSSTPTLAVTGTTTVSGTHSGTSSGTNTGDQTTISGNAGTATALQTPRAINGTSFDGTANVITKGILVYDDFHRTNTASGVLGITPTGQAYTSITSGAQISNNTYIAPEGTTVYAYVNAGALISRIGMKASWVVGTGSIGQSVAMALTPDASINNLSVHFYSSYLGWTLQTRTAGGAFITVATYTYPTALLRDGTPYDFEINIIDTMAYVTAAGVKATVHSSVFSTLKGNYAYYEHFYGAGTSDAISTIREVYTGVTANSPVRNYVALTGSDTLTGTKTFATNAIFLTGLTSVTSIASATSTASASLTTPNIYGSTGAAGNLVLNSTSNGTKGKVSFETSGAYDIANHYFGIGTITPAAILHLAQNITAAASTTNGIGLRVAPFTYTDNSSSGTVTAMYINTLGTATLIASNATTYTDCATLFVNPPGSSTNVTQTNSFAAIFNGNVQNQGGGFTIKRGAAGTIGTSDAQILNIATSSASRTAYSAAGLQTHTHTSTSGVSWTMTQPAATSSTLRGLLWTAGAHTSASVNTEIIDINWDLSAVLKSVDGTIPTNRSFLIQGRTLTPQTSTLTVTNPITLEVNPPIAGSGTTFSNRALAIRSTGDLQVTGTNSTFVHVVGGGSAPTIAAGTGAGTSPTVSVTGTDLGGYISVTTGTLPTLAAAVVTITFNTAFTVAPRCISLSSANSNTSTLSGASMAYVNQAGITTTTFAITAGATALTAATAYQWYYQVIQ